MNALNITLIIAIVICCLSLVTSRQQQRLDHAAWVRAQKEALRLDQDYQNLRAKQQQFEKTERIERIARTQLGMERASSARVEYVTQERLGQ